MVNACVSLLSDFYLETRTRINVSESWCSWNLALFRAIYKYATLGAQRVCAQPPLCPCLAESEPSLQMLARFPSRLSLSSLHVLLWNPHPYTAHLSLHGLRWWASWSRSGSTSARPAPCGTTWWRRMMCRPTWSVSLTSSTTSRSRRSLIYGSCRKCW